MARKRMIDPSIWTDEGMAELTPRQQLLYIGLFSNADDDGRLKGSPVAVALSLPTLYAGVGRGDVQADLDAVCAVMRQLVPYTVDGRPYLAFRKYRQWQKIDKPTPSILPAPPDDSSTPREPFDEPSTNGSGPLDPNRIEGKGREENGREGAAADATDPATPDDPPTPETPKIPKPEPTTKPQPGKPMGRNGAAQTLLAVLHEDVLKIGPPTNYGQAVKQAQRLADAGCTPDELEKIAYWLLGDPWHAEKGVTITSVINNRDKWKSAQNAPKGGLTVHKTDRPMDAAARSRAEWRKRNGIPERPSLVPDPIDDDVIETAGRIAR